jgi:hypothetical protein
VQYAPEGEKRRDEKGIELALRTHHPAVGHYVLWTVFATYDSTGDLCALLE